MKRMLLSLLAIPLSFGLLADEPKKPAAGKEDPPKKAPPSKPPTPKITLKVGDKAPPLKVTTWLQGAAVDELKTGQVYVVEFWATWCGPCIVMMPHLADLSEHYKDKGVTVIGYSAKDPNNDSEKVATFVSKRGPKLKYTFAYADDRDTYDAWMRAAGQNGIPCTFVIGRDGKIAYIGHPMYLDIVLPKVADGSWIVGEDNDKLKAVEADVNAVFKATSAQDAEAGLKALKDFDAKYPALTKIPYFVGPRIRLMLKTGMADDAARAAKDAIAEAVKKDDSSMLGQVASTLIGPDAKKDKNLTAMALDAVERMIKIVGDKDLSGQYTLAKVRFAAGDKKAARAAAERFVELAPERSREAYKRMLKEILEDEAPKRDDSSN